VKEGTRKVKERRGEGGEKRNRRRDIVIKVKGKRGRETEGYRQ